MLQSGVPYIRTYVRTYGPPGDIDEATYVLSSTSFVVELILGSCFVISFCDVMARANLTLEGSAQHSRDGRTKMGRKRVSPSTKLTQFFLTFLVLFLVPGSEHAALGT